MSREAFHQSEERFHLLVESVQDYAIFMLTPEGRVDSWNEGARRIKQYTASEIVGQHFSVFYTERDREQGVPQRGLQAAAAEGRFEAEGWRVRQDGSLFWANVVITALRDAEGHLLGFGKVTRDLTDRKRAEDERTARLAAEEAIRVRDAFISVAAHELKTPLTSLKATAQLLRLLLERGSALDHGRTLKSLQLIDQQASKMSALITQLLDVTRIQSGKLLLERTTKDLVSLVGEVVLSAQMRTEQHTMTLHAPPSVMMSLDALRMEQVLTNVLDNAIKYSPGGGAIEVTVTQPSPEVAQVAVRDHGLGIPPEQRAHIFKRFYQAHTEHYLSGLGLGLYISQEIVTLHGGHISVDFPTDGGTRFVVTLPTGEGATRESASGEEDTPNSEPSSSGDP